MSRLQSKIESWSGFDKHQACMTNGPGLFFWRSFFGALPEFFRGWAESAL
jgi:hypothetical protein